MKFPRRQFFRLAAGAAALPAVSRIAWAQTYPTRPVSLTVSFAAGGDADITARVMGRSLSDRIGQPIVIENRTGGGGNIGTGFVARAPADGYTLLLVATSNTINAALYDKLNFNFIRDIAPVAGIMRAPYVMVVNPSVPAKTVSEFMAYAKANPGKLKMASAATGTGSHFSGEMFKMLTGIDMVHVPYRGTRPALIDLLDGQAQVMFIAMFDATEHITAGKLRPLAVTTATRSEALPDIPTMNEFVPGYEASNWYGLGAPKGTPAEVVEKLNKEINASLGDPNMKAKFAVLGGSVFAGSPTDFGKFIAEETEKWAKVIKFAGIKIE